MHSLHKCFKKTSVVPSSTSAYSFLTKKDVDSANNVETALAEKQATTSRVGLKYNTYMPQQRAEIGKYAAEYGNTRAAKHFSTVLDCKILESTARRLKKEYILTKKTDKKRFSKRVLAFYPGGKVQAAVC